MTMTKTEQNQNASALRKYTLKIQELQKIVDEIKHNFIDYMESENLEELTGNGFKITYKTVKSSRFDSKALAKADPSLYNEFVIETETKRFNFK